jgi:uracil-DNA glycosylase family 4
MLETQSPERLLAWYLEAGVDESIGETPVDRTLAPIKAAPVPAPPPQAAIPPAPAFAVPLPPRPAERPAPSRSSAALAAEAKTLEELKAAYLQLEGVALKATATQLVFADGNPQARLMCIGEAPGGEEDRQGLPFVGPAGKLLDKMLASIGLDRQNAYIANLLPWRPPGNRTPTSEEVALLLPFLERHIELADPEVIVLLGGSAAQAVLARPEGIGKLRGQWHKYSSRGLARPADAMATFHPAYLLRQPAQKREAWRDWRQIARRLADKPIDF